MTIGLIIALAAILVLPFFVKYVGHNLEIFLFVMGLIALTISQVISIDLFEHILRNEMLYFIIAAVLISEIIFKFIVEKLTDGIRKVAQKYSLLAFLFVFVAALGLLSSIITAIIASIVLVEVVRALPIEKQYKIKLTIITCFSWSRFQTFD